MAHIEGGEFSEGAIDDAVRNALTKMSHVHFTSTERARERVISMGEEPWRVHCAGAPSLDHLRRSALLSREEIGARLGVDFAQSPVLVVYHPVTLLSDTVSEVDALFEALEAMPDQLLFCYPNADAGSRDLIARAEAFLRVRGSGKIFVNLPPVQYWSLLKQVRMMIGNSSSGIMETGSFGLPTVNVGLRQKGRERPANVLDAAPTSISILERVKEAGSSEFRRSLAGMCNPYGDGYAAERIVRVLTSLPERDELLMKHGSGANS